MLDGWTRTDFRKSLLKATHLEDHLEDGEIVGNLPLKERRRGGATINRSTDLQEVGREEQIFRLRQ